MNTPDHRNVVFIDFGYSKLSVFAVQFTNTAARLVDYDHLKFTGSKNIDRLLAEFYNDEFKKITKTDISLLNTPKALVKLNENI